MNINYKEKLEITRIVVSTLLLVTAIYGMFNHSIGWGWFLFSGVLLYPKCINIDFREHNG